MTDGLSLTRRSLLARSSAVALAAGTAALTARPTRAQSTTTLKVATGPTESAAQAYYAQDRGLFTRHGLSVELVKLRGGPVAMAAMVAGDLQIGVGNTLSLAAAHQRGLPFVIMAPGALYDANRPTALIVTAASSDIKSAKDLSGKTVGGISLASIDQLAFDAFLDKAGVDYTSSKFIELPPSTMADALVQGRIQAAIINDPDLSIALAAGTVKPLAKGYEAVSRLFLNSVWFSVQSWLDQNKDVAARFAASVSEAGHWANANPEAAVEILRRNTEQREGRTRVLFARRLDVALIQPVFDAAFKYKMIGQVRATDLCWNGQ